MILMIKPQAKSRLIFVNVYAKYAYASTVHIHIDDCETMCALQQQYIWHNLTTCGQVVNGKSYLKFYYWFS